MAITNEQLADILIEIADTLEEYEDNPYRIRAYRKAANSIKKYKISIEELVNHQEDLTIIPNVGTRLSEKIKKIIHGESFLPKIKPALPYPDVLSKKPRQPPFFKIYSVISLIDKIINYLSLSPHIEKISTASDYRRCKEVVSDIDLLASGTHAENIFSYFHQFSSVEYIIYTNKNKTIVQLRNGLRVTLHLTDHTVFAINLLKLTGSNNHFKKIKTLAKTKNLKITIRGAYHDQSKIIFKTEKDIYNALGLDYIPPELREDRGEIEAALRHALPHLVTLSDIKGDLHCHTIETDGTETLEKMAETAYSHGYQYVSITDHSQSLKITRGMDKARLLKQIDQINKLNDQFSNFVILKSMEVDILEDGALDMPNEVLKKLDLTVCSIHSKFNLSSEKQTERIIRAMDNPYFNILGHATGRLMHRRPPYQLDIEKILQAAKERNCFIEVNAQPARLDINDLYCLLAKKIGVKVAISSDAHSTLGFRYMQLGINQARRGWLEPNDVINTYHLSALKKLLKKT